MFSSSSSAIVLVFQLTLCFLGAVNAAPLLARQSLSTPESLTTYYTYSTPEGLMTETCNMMLNPLTDGSGNMQEVQSCSVAPAAPDAQVGTSASIAPTASAAAPVSSAAAAPTSAAAPTAAASSDVATAPAVSTAVAASSAAASEPAVSATPSVSAPAASDTALADNTPTAAANNEANAPSGTAAADTAVTTLPPFAIPGRHILIPPYGLIIFCVVTGIGILVFTFVTWERTRYRKSFRKRKLAEAGAAMGYGGMGKA